MFSCFIDWHSSWTELESDPLPVTQLLAQVQHGGRPRPDYFVGDSTHILKFLISRWDLFVVLIEQLWGLHTEDSWLHVRICSPLEYIPRNFPKNTINSRSSEDYGRCSISLGTAPVIADHSSHLLRRELGRDPHHWGAVTWNFETSLLFRNFS